LLGAAKRLGTRNRQDAVDELHRHRIAGDLWNEIRRPALHRMRLEARMSRGRRAVRVPLLLDVATEQLRILRLANHDPGLGTLLLEHPRDTLERSAGAIAGHPI